jgi:hypothetical protein
MKQTAVEWLLDKYIIVGGITQTMVEQAKEMEKEQKNQMYNETEVLQLLLKLIQTESFDNLKEWFEQNKKTCYHPLTERRHTSDTHFECTICGYNNY